MRWCVCMWTHICKKERTIPTPSLPQPHPLTSWILMCRPWRARWTSSSWGRSPSSARRPDRDSASSPGRSHSWQPSPPLSHLAGERGREGEREGERERHRQQQPEREKERPRARSLLTLVLHCVCVCVCVCVCERERESLSLLQGALGCLDCSLQR